MTDTPHESLIVSGNTLSYAVTRLMLPASKSTSGKLTPAVSAGHIFNIQYYLVHTAFLSVENFTSPFNVLHLEQSRYGLGAHFIIVT